MDRVISSVDLTNCDREPIHIPAAIQPHGALIVCTEDLIVEQVSANLAELTGVAADKALGAPLDRVLAHAGCEAIKGRLEHLTKGSVVLVAAKNGRRFDAILHRGAGAVFVELEPHAIDLSGYHPILKEAVARFQSTTAILDLCNIAAEHVRLLTGFDRVMIYRFDREWNGEVIAESKRQDLGAFLGHHYPASDIPVQARRLYTVNWLRLIPDAAYVPVPIVPPTRPSGDALDMSHSVLRSVSPIHCEYLANMGVRASMSISLLRDGELWGLIACHHYAGPRLVPFALRDSAEFLGQTLSWNITTRERAIDAQRERDSQRIESELVRAMTMQASFLDGLATPALLRVTNAEGAAVVFEDEIRLVGATPDAIAVRNLADWVREHLEDDVFATDNLGALRPPVDDEFSTRASGVLAVAISKTHREFVLWFRPSTEQTISWAGNPQKVVDANAPRLTPRGSFALWIETIRGKSLPWQPWEMVAASNLRRVILSGVRRRAAELRELADKLAEADRMKDTFLAAVSHELRTPLNAIAGWSRILRSRQSPERFTHALDVIERNATAQTQLIEDLLDVSRMTSGKMSLDVQPVELASIVTSALEAVALSADAKGIRLRPVIDGSPIIVGDAKRLQQVVWNLVTNAIKFTPKGGRVDLVVRRLSSDVEITVTDSGQGIHPDFLPHIFDSFRQAETHDRRGLGLGLAIARHIVELHGGRITAESAGEGKGASFRIILPVSAVQPPPSDTLEAHAPLPVDDVLSELRVMLVEDEPDSQELVVEVLRQRGAIVSAFSNAEDALREMAIAKFDIVISDIGLPGIDGYEFMRRVRALPKKESSSLPAVAITAYARPRDRMLALTAGFQSYIAKPVDPEELVTVVCSLCARTMPTPIPNEGARRTPV